MPQTQPSPRNNFGQVQFPAQMQEDFDSTQAHPEEVSPESLLMKQQQQHEQPREAYLQAQRNEEQGFSNTGDQQQ